MGSFLFAAVVESADTADLKSAVFGRTGSSPVSGTNEKCSWRTLFSKLGIGVFAFPCHGKGWVAEKDLYLPKLFT